MTQRDHGLSGALPLQKLGAIELVDAADELGHRWLSRYVHLAHTAAVEVLFRPFLTSLVRSSLYPPLSKDDLVLCFFVVRSWDAVALLCT